jgi:hypothetical protein
LPMDQGTRPARRPTRCQGAAWRAHTIPGDAAGVTLIEHNRRIEALWRRGEITFEAFNWWLHWVCGV